MPWSTISGATTGPAGAAYSCAPQRICILCLPIQSSWHTPTSDSSRRVRETDFEVRVFSRQPGITEDPVTGSLNAALGQWLIGAGLAPDSYTVLQGRALGRRGLISVELHLDDVWVGGETVTVIDGTVSL